MLNKNVPSENDFDLCYFISHKSIDIEKTVEADYSKKFTLKSKEDGYSKLPDVFSRFKSKRWMDDDLMEVKKDLNDVKSKLNYFNLKFWHNHTRRMNHAGAILSTLRKDISPEFLTQAWCKFYEVVSSYNLIPKQALSSKRLNSVHLCEAPGAFITSLNHYLQVNHPDIKWDWRASTLNPSFEGNNLSYMVNDDRFILLTLEKWCFGEDETGNLFSYKNLLNLTNSVKPIEPIMLVTADGSIDCQNDPGEQEHIVSALHFCETITALSILGDGGSFLLKMFTMYESDTICLLYMLSSFFESIEVFKPASSKEGNSEVYLVCLNYQGKKASEMYVDVFMGNYGEKITSKTLFSKEEIPHNFLDKIRRCATFFKNLQVSVIGRNIRTFKKNFYCDERDFIYQVRLKHSEMYISRYNVTPLTMPHQFIIGNENISRNIPLCLDPKNDENLSFVDRKAQENNDSLTILKLEEQLNNVKIHWEYDDLHWLDTKDFSKTRPLVPLFGKPIQKINNSKFCLGNLLSIWNELRTLNKNSTINGAEAVNECLVNFEEYLSQCGLNCRTCDLTSLDWNEDAEKIHYYVIFQFYNNFKQMVLNDNFTILGVHLLTRFLVSIVHIVADFFEKVGFFNPEKFGNVIVFSSLKGKRDLLSLMEDIKKECFKYINDKSIHSLLPVTELCDGEPYKFILTVNNLTLRKECYNILSKIPHHKY